MTMDDSQADDLAIPMAIVTGPPDVPAPSRMARLLTSWKLSLVGLMLAVVAIGVSLGARGYQRLQAMHYLDENNCEYELTVDSEWITEWFGDWAKGFCSVDEIYLTVISDESFSRISIFSELRRLRTAGRLFAHHGEISDRGVEALGELSRLEVLYIGKGEFSDRQLANLLSSDLPLVEVTLVSGEPSRQTLEALARIPTLTSLELFAPLGPDDEAFRDLAPFKNLQHLTITRVGPECVRWLEDLPRLEVLGVTAREITWEFVEVLRGIPTLKRIGILAASIDDPDLRSAVEQEWELDIFPIPGGVDNLAGGFGGGGNGFF